MKNTIIKVSLFILITFYLPNVVSAQWWNLYGPGQLKETVETANGDLVSGGFFRNLATGTSDGLVLRTDAEGNELWRLTFPGSDFSNDFNLNSSITKIDETTEGNLLVAYNYISSEFSSSIILYKISNDGTIIWEKPMEELVNYHIGTFLEHPTTQELLITVDNYLQFADSATAQIIVLDEVGNLLRRKTYQRISVCCHNPLTPKAVHITDGYVIGIRDSLYRLDHSLTEIWSTNTNGDETKDLIKTEEGNFIWTTMFGDLGGPVSTQFLKLDENGVIAWNTSFSINSVEFITLIKKPNENFNVIYKEPKYEPFGPSFGQKNIIRRTLSNTGEIGAKEMLPPTLLGASNLAQTSNGDLIFMGSNNAFPSNVPSGFLLRTDCEVSGFNNVITGRIYIDENFDCAYDSTEQLLPNYPIQFIHNSGLSYYVTSDSSGIYSLEVASGSYQMSVIPQSSYEIPCTPKIVNFTTNDTTIQTDLPIQRIIECPQMTVSIGSPFLRRCFENTYTVRYCNSGTIDAADAYLEIQLDSFTIFENSSIPPTSQNGSLLVFDLGDVISGDCDAFRITTTLSCDAELGQNHCVTANIYPDSICLADSPNWDGSSIQVSAQCTEDSVRFFINNLGTGDMLAPLEYIVIQDEIFINQDEFQLNSGNSIQRSFPANGSTYRMEAMQSIGHPGSSMPSATVEGCGEWPFATGFFGYFPQDDNDLFVDADCQTNIGSFDPNDKSAFPVGYDDQKVIDPSTLIEYKIRFQNTGTDTAFNVSIRDTLSTLLDPASLTMGAASHRYNWRLEDQGTLIVDFPDILLPDSTTNLTGSNGFVSFKVSVKPAPTLPYFWVRNKAAIYFDFNEPIITNEVRHSIDTSFVDIISSIKTNTPITNRVKIAPNPARDHATLTFPENSKFPLTLKLYSQDGRLIRTETINDFTTTLDVEKLTAGIYYYGVYDEQGLWASGKLMVQ